MNTDSQNISSAKAVPAGRQLKASAEEIKFATDKSELGTILVARSEAGVCAILIGDEVEALQRDLAEEFTETKFVLDDRALRADLDKVSTFIKTSGEGTRPAARYSRNALSAARLGRPARSPGRLQDYLRRTRLPHWRAGRRPRRRQRLRGQCNRPGYPVSSYGRKRRRPCRLPLGHGAQASHAREGSGGARMTIQLRTQESPSVQAAESRVATYDWVNVSEELNAQGCAVLEKLLSPKECRQVAALYPPGGAFSQSYPHGPAWFR